MPNDAPHLETSSLLVRRAATREDNPLPGGPETPGSVAERDERLRTALRQIGADYPDLLFSGSEGRNDIHDIAQYPAMMVPAMQGKLLDAVCLADPSVGTVFDPFTGSGTILVEAARRRLAFIGYDINPYAVLIAGAKGHQYEPAQLTRAAEAAIARVREDSSTDVAVAFTGLGKWFPEETAKALSRIRRAITAESDAATRKLLWVALAETVRLTSNSRTSTFKLHVRSVADRESRVVDGVARFETVLRRVVSLVLSEAARESAADTKARRSLSITVGDVRSLSAAAENERCDVLISSPPYGDNATTVPYGQFSFLPLQWITLGDISPDCPTLALTSTHALDSASLGGSRRIDDGVELKLRTLSKAYAEYLDQLPSDVPKDRRSRVTAFVRDLNAAVTPILSRLRPGAYLCWTVGNRRVANRPVPLNKIIRELFEGAGCVHVEDVKRRIPSKRMAVKNSVSETMRGEVVVVLRYAGTRDAESGP